MPRVRRNRRSGLGRFASKFEKRIYDNARKRRIRIQYEPETFVYERRIRGAHCQDCSSRNVVKRSRYTPDFRTSPRFLIEAKGKFDASARSRMEDFVRSRPDVQIRFLFGADNWTTKRHVQRYTDWCRERGITCAVGDRIPETWVEPEGKNT